MSDIIVEIKYKDEIKYPVAKIESGTSYIGMKKTFAKPHGLTEIMERIVKELRKGPRRYSSFISRLKTDYSLRDIDNALEIMLIDGVIKKHSKNTRPQKSDLTWVPVLLELDSRAIKDLLLPQEESENKLLTLKTELMEILTGIDNDSVNHLLACINEQKIKTLAGEEICGLKAWQKYRSILLTLAYAIRFQEEGRIEPLRLVSERIWGESKIVERYKDELIKVFGKHSLANLNLSMMPETVFFYGNIRYTCNESLGSGLAGSPVSLTEDTIRNLRIFEVNVDSILIIENLAVFLELLKRKYYGQSNVLVLWGAGYLSSPKKILVNKILKFKDIPIYIWSDLDLEGLMLTKNMLEEFQWTKSTNRPILMTNNELQLTKGNFKGATRINKGNEDLQKIFGDVVSLIESGLSMEQEELLIHFEEISGKLP